MATHWGGDGNVDNFASRGFAVFALPLILLAVNIFIILLSMLDKKNKTQNQQQLVEYLQNELATATHGAYPHGWSKFGGWTALKREATGFFRTEKIDGKWWLIDPEGYGFFSTVSAIPPDPVYSAVSKVIAISTNFCPTKTENLQKPGVPPPTSPSIWYATALTVPTNWRCFPLDGPT